MPLVSIPYISRVLDPEGVGRVSFIDSFTYYFIVMAEFGIVVYGIREVARVKNNREALSRLVSELVSLHIITSCISIVVYSVAVYFAWSKIHDWRLLAFSLSFLFVNSFACEWYYYGQERFRFITTRSLFTRLAGLAGIFLLIHEPKDYYLYYGIIVAAAVGNILLSIGTLAGEIRPVFKNLQWKKHIARTWLTYSISLLYGISIMLDNVLLGLVTSAAFIAFYAFAVKLTRLSSVALTDTLLVFFPHAVTLLHENQLQKFQRLILQTGKLIILFSIPISAGLFLFAGHIVTVFFGPQFQRVALDLRILSLVPVLKCANLFLSKQVLLVYDKEKLYIRSLIVAGAIFIISTLILSSYFSDVGACYSILLYEAILLSLNYYYARKVAPSLQLFKWKTFLQAFTGVLMFLPLRYFFDNMELNGFSLALIIILCAALYVAFEIFVLKVFVIPFRLKMKRGE